MIARIKGYLTDVKKELGKVTWLTRQEIRGSTIVVICFSFIMAMVISLIDIVILFITIVTITILAINLERLQDASMGYFISPIIYIVLGYIFLKEKMTNLRLLSVILMFISIIFLLITTNTIPILAIIVALTWSFYGLIRKKIKVSSEIVSASS